MGWKRQLTAAIGLLLVTGFGVAGSREENRALSQTIEPGVFSKTGSLGASRTQHTATLLLDGRVLIVGGWGTDECDSDRQYGCTTPRTTAELYDPETGRFIRTGRLISDRTGHTATLLPSGKVLIVGGQKAYQKAISSAELYDPVTGRFTAAGALTTARSNHTATLLPNGRVLIAGGSGGEDYDVLASAELYDPATDKFTKAGTMVTARVVHTATLQKQGHP